MESQGNTIFKRKTKYLIDPTAKKKSYQDLGLIRKELNATKTI